MFPASYFPGSYWTPSYWPKVGITVPDEEEPFVRRHRKVRRAVRHSLQDSTVRVLFGGSASATVVQGFIDPALRTAIARLGFAAETEIAGALVQDARADFTLQSIGVGRTVIGRWPGERVEALGYLGIFARASAKIENPIARAAAFDLAVLELESTEDILRAIIEHEESDES